ncbi:MAG: Fe-S-containing hydro-lyase [Clostridia bacterium]|nr:Fe-S-containing hydro-lyase [Clostridia bacterium]
MKKKIQTPLTNEIVESLKAGDQILLSGTIYTGRDAAHARLIECLKNNEPLPFDIEGSILYYVGPAPSKPGEAIGSCGPTTSYRMDDLTTPLLDLGLKGMVGKGKRDLKVIESMKQNKAVYFAAIGGAGALIANSVISSEIIAYEDLGAEAIRKLEVKDFPCIVVIDCYGENMYETERQKYERK